MEESSTLKRYLMKYKDLLCNLTRKNKEFYYKEGAGSVSLSYLTVPNDFKRREEYLKEFKPLELNSGAFENIFESGGFSLTKFFNLDKYENPALEKKLDKIRVTDDNYQKEFGISGAWLLGPFLVWKLKSEAELEFVTVTPIFKLAIDVEKNKNKDVFLKLEDSDLYLNPTLKLALYKEYNVELPEKFEGLNIHDALKIVVEGFKAKNISVTYNHKYKRNLTVPPRKKIIRDDDGNKIKEEPIELKKVLNNEEYEIYRSISSDSFVIHDVFSVDTFNASKMSLYYDYDSIIGDLSHPLINELFLGVSIPEKIDKSKLKELNEYKEKDNYFVVDIDSSQHLAIDEAKNRKALVIQGPPGTGKSQTITNMISQLLSENKKVLFVAEKRVALDVVYQRLKANELDKQTLIIHNSELNRKELYNSFVEFKNEEYHNNIEQSWDKLTNELDFTKNKITTYALELKETDDRSGLLKSDVFALNAEYAHISYDSSIAHYFQNVKHDKIELLLKEISSLQVSIKNIQNLSENFWLYRQKKFSSSKHNKSNIEKLNKQIKENASEVEELVNKAYRVFNNKHLNLEIESIKFTNHEDWELIHYILVELNSNHSFLKISQQSILTLDDLKKLLDSFLLFKDSADYILMKSYNDYFSKSRGFFDWFTPKYWNMKKGINAILTVPFEKLTLNREILHWIQFYEAKEEIKKTFKAIGFPKPIGNRLGNYEGLVSLEHDLEISIKLFKNLERILANDLTGYLKKDFNSYKNDYSNYVEIINDILNKLSLVGADLDEIISFSNWEMSFNRKTLNQDGLINYIAIADKALADLAFVDDIERLDFNISQIENYFNLKDFKELFVNKLTQLENPKEYIEAQIVKVWHEKILENSQSLKFFNSDAHTENIRQFSDLVQQHKDVAKKTVGNNLARIKHSTSSINPLKLAEISREANKQRRIKAPRELMETGCLETMLSIKRCWLMSPLSISQVLPNVKELFDVVIFDEASQVKVEDAIPAIYRGKNLIVVGDKNQMPPTNFFSGNVDLDDEDEDEIELGESILDQALRAYPDVLLEWHYRSQSEALIAFSNYAFYGGRLIAPPNPTSFVKDRSIEFVSVKNATFNTKEGNQAEARLVVDEIVRILGEKATTSIGVISMGVSQQKVIEKLLDEEVEKNKVFASNYEKALSHKEDGAFAGFFNKNLENVQGDERDYIIISVGYAPSTVGGKLRQAFGPLSTKGGERRLNVAITRAKKGIKVFCSFDPSVLEISEEAFSNLPAKTCFARYLNYAKAISEEKEDVAKNILNMFSVSGNVSFRKSSRFNLDVKREIEKLGYKVDAEIGACGFYIDLAVEHPNVEKTYILGIECDGAIFHSSDYARDRDRARQSLLESRGWRIHRIWSQDWSKNRQLEIEKIKILLDRLLK